MNCLSLSPAPRRENSGQASNGGIYYRAIGSAEALMAKAEELGQTWMKGVAGDVARKLLRERPT